MTRSHRNRRSDIRRLGPGKTPVKTKYCLFRLERQNFVCYAGRAEAKATPMMLPDESRDRLQNRVKDLVNHRETTVTLREIAKEAKVSESWLKMFAQGKIASPAANKVIALYEYFTKKPLSLQ